MKLDCTPGARPPEDRRTEGNTYEATQEDFEVFEYVQDILYNKFGISFSALG